MIPRGHLNAIVTIQRDTGTTKDAMGSPVENWQAQYTDYWCMWEPKNGDDQFDSNQKVSKQPITVTMDYISDVTGSDRILKDSKVYRILGEPEYTEYRGLAEPDTMILKCVRFDNE